MKLNTLLFGLIIAPATMLVGCSDYEDTETASQQADPDAIGAFFASNAQTVQVRPDSAFFPVILNRATDAKAVQVPVTIKKKTNNVFDKLKTTFAFADGKQEAVEKLEYNPTVFQRVDTLALEVEGGKKSHIYADGYTSTSIAFSVDYAWKDSLQTKITDELSDKLDNVEASAPHATSVQVAMDYAKDKAEAVEKDGRTILRVPNLFATTGLASKGDAHIQFYVDKDKKNPKLLNTEFFKTEENIDGLTVKEVFETGMTQPVRVMEKGKLVNDTLPVFVKFINISSTVSGKVTKYEITSEVFAAKKADATTTYQVGKVKKEDEKNQSTTGKTSNKTTFEVEFAGKTPEQK